jgi:hypothetical protein
MDRKCDGLKVVDDNLREHDLDAERTAAEAGPDMVNEFAQILSEEV